MRRPNGQPCVETKEFNLVRNMLIAAVEERYRDAALAEEQEDQIDFSCFSGNLRHDERDNGFDCWKISDGNNFRVRSKQFCYDKTKIPTKKPLMDLVTVDWSKDTKRMDHVARCQGCAAQVLYATLLLR